MGYEAATYINELVATNPVHLDDREAQGYLHIQNIKQALKNTFPTATVPLTATQTELNAWAGLTVNADELNIMSGVTATTAQINYLAGTTSNIQTQLDAATIQVLAWSKKTSSFVAQSGFRYVCQGGGSITFPTSPSANDVFVVHATGGTWSTFITSGSLTLNGDTYTTYSFLWDFGGGTYLQSGRSAVFRYIDSTTGWLGVLGY